MHTNITSHFICNNKKLEIILKSIYSWMTDQIVSSYDVSVQWNTIQLYL
jgi:hypothetical protein